jgi:hypothetical protein
MKGGDKPPFLFPQISADVKICFREDQRDQLEFLVFDTSRI